TEPIDLGPFVLSDGVTLVPNGSAVTFTIRLDGQIVAGNPAALTTTNGSTIYTPLGTTDTGTAGNLKIQATTPTSLLYFRQDQIVALSPVPPPPSPPEYVDDFQLLRQARTAAITALVGGDYNIAIQQALSAQAILASIPSNAVRGAGPMGGNQQVAWNAEAIDSFIVRCRQQQSAVQGVTYQPITRTSPQHGMGTTDSFGEPY